jgi:TM2 domain-containing membrane protein YozV
MPRDDIELDEDDYDDRPARRGKEDNKKVAAGILAILLGWVGVHKFYLGYTTPGILMLVVGVCTGFTVSSIIGIVEGIIYLTKSDEEFYRTYQVGKKEWF